MWNRQTWLTAFVSASARLDRSDEKNCGETATCSGVEIGKQGLVKVCQKKVLNEVKIDKCADTRK